MVKSKTNGKVFLIAIIIIQVLILSVYLVSNSVSQMSNIDHYMALVERDNENYLLVRTGENSELILTSNEARFINFEDGKVHLFNKNYDYLNSLHFDSNIEVIEESVLENIEYINTEFSCKLYMCTIKNNLEHVDDNEVQVFTTRDQDLLYLDADNIVIWDGYVTKTYSFCYNIY